MPARGTRSKLLRRAPGRRYNVPGRLQDSSTKDSPRETPAMPSPFPGMDPYLEDDRLWAAFHHQLVSCLYQVLLPSLVDRYRARFGQRHYVTEQALFTS